MAPPTKREKASTFASLSSHTHGAHHIKKRRWKNMGSEMYAKDWAQGRLLLCTELMVIILNATFSIYEITSFT
jgi:hypothetical protein